MCKIYLWCKGSARCTTFSTNYTLPYWNNRSKCQDAKMTLMYTFISSLEIGVRRVVLEQKVNDCSTNPCNALPSKQSHQPQQLSYRYVNGHNRSRSDLLCIFFQHPLLLQLIFIYRIRCKSPFEPKRTICIQSYKIFQSWSNE